MADCKKIDNSPTTLQCEECGNPVTRPVTANADQEVNVIICDDCIRKTIENS